MTGLSRTTGRMMDASTDAHVIQSIEDILTTPIGQRIMRPTYGSFLFELIDQPLNPLTRIRVFAATAMALMAWEPRGRLKRVALDLAPAAHGRAVLHLQLVRIDLPRPRALHVSLVLPFSPA